MDEGLKIIKGGKLIKTEWVYDAAKENGEYIESDVTDQAVRLLFDKCELAENVTLRDIFLLLNTELSIFDCVLSNWCKEIVIEGLTGSKSDDSHAKGIDYLELYWSFDINQEWQNYPDGPRTPEPGSIKARLEDKDEGNFTGKKGLFGYSFPEFHGVHFITEADRNNPDEPWYKDAGEDATQNYAVSFCSTADLIDIPLKLCKNLIIAENYVASQDYKNYRKELFENCEYSLGHILYGILWELSWHGAPSDRDSASAELRSLTKEAFDDGKKQ